MLEKLLDRISGAGSISTLSLAQELGVSEELIEAMVADLVRAGYLRPVAPCGEGECGACRSAMACKYRGKIWALVRKELPG